MKQFDTPNSTLARRKNEKRAEIKSKISRKNLPRESDFENNIEYLVMISELIIVAFSQRQYRTAKFFQRYLNQERARIVNESVYTS